MRTHGTLSKWNDDRGFGFITPSQGSGEVFVHISAFPRDGIRPKLNELISYEMETGKDGKSRAVRVMRPGQKSSPRHTRSYTPYKRSSSVIETIVGIVIFALIGSYAYSQINTHTPSSAPAAFVKSVPPSNFHCDGRTMCSQMTSCAEARNFLQNCPGTKMDGDGDGVPCEQQWCN